MDDRLRQMEFGQGAASVDVCICTFRRDSLIQTLRSIAAQRDLAGRTLRVIVADNDEQPSAEARCRATCNALGLALEYRHAPARSISIARNACLDAATADWIAFIDDDETAQPTWLSSLFREADTGRWDAVLGPVMAAYSSSAPSWMQLGDFHSTRPVMRGGEVQAGYSGNVLIRRVLVERAGLRFDLSLGRTGGEDVDFFYQLHDAGGRIGFAPDAWAVEPVPDARANLNWLLLRAFRAGQTYGARQARIAPTLAVRAAQAGLAAAKAAVCGLGAIATTIRPISRNRYIVRGALHVGVLARLAGMSEIELY